jgi:phosphate/sulfate permease
VWVWSAALGTVAPLAVAAGAWLVGAPVDARAAIVAAAAGFALAAAVAPMLRHSEIRDAATTFDDPLSGGGMP